MPSYTDVKRDPDKGGWHGYKAVILADGTRKVVHRRGKSAAEASNRLKDAVAKVEAGEVALDPTKLTFAEYVEWWLGEQRGTIAFATHAHDYAWKLRNIAREIGGVRMGKLAVSHMRAVETFLRERARVRGVDAAKPQGYPQTTVHAHFRTLNVMLNDAVKRRHIGANPTKALTVKRGERVEPRMFRREEAVTLLRHAMSSRLWSARVATHLTIGARQGEVLALRWDDLDWDHALLTIRGSVERRLWEHGCADPAGCGPDEKPLMRARRCPQRQGGGLFIKETKGKRRRTILLPAALLDTLREHRERQDLERAQSTPVWVDQGLIFPAANGALVDKSADQKAWARLLAAAGVEHKGTHAARHFFATYALRDGATIHAVSQTLGHHRDSFTHDTYVGDVADGQLGIAALSNKLLREAQPRRLRSVG